MKEKKLAKCYSDASKLCWVMAEKIVADGTHKKGLIRANLMTGNGKDWQEGKVVGNCTDHRKGVWTIFNYCPFCGSRYYTIKHRLAGVTVTDSLVTSDVFVK